MEDKEQQIFPRVSVITPVYNRQASVKSALLSAMQQQYPNMEFVVVNDGSHDDTQKIIESMQEQDPRIILINNSQNLWISTSRNIGMQHASGEIFAVLDSDDIRIDSNKLTKQVSFLKENPKVGILWTNSIVKKKLTYRRKNEHLTDKDIRWNTIKATQFVHSTMVYPRKVYEKIGGYNPQIKYADDREFQLRAGKHFEFANLSEYMVLYNSHTDNVSHMHRKRQAFESMYLSLKYSGDYPNALLGISKKILKNAFFLTTKPLDILVPGTTDYIRTMIRGKKEFSLELSVVGNNQNQKINNQISDW